jgi:hypothetical protein
LPVAALYALPTSPKPKPPTFFTPLPTVFTAPTIPLSQPFFLGVASVAAPA